MEISGTTKSIWQAGVNAVKSDHLLGQVVQCEPHALIIAGQPFALAHLRHIEVLGCGKAGRGMAAGLVRALSALPTSISVSGHINVPADCAEALANDFEAPQTVRTRCFEIAQNVTLCAARPAGLNEPTEAGIQGTEEILKRLSRQSETDLTIFLVSGGGSALLEAPRPGLSLLDVLAVTQSLARSGATIQELNTVRSHLSAVKGGGLLCHARSGSVISLVVSDIIGDPLALIASGPTVPTSTSPSDALAVLQKYVGDSNPIPQSVWDVLTADQVHPGITVDYSNHLIGTNAVACSAAADSAKDQGFQVVSLGSENCGEAADFGRLLVDQLRGLRDRGRPDSGRGYCLIAGGETTVTMQENVRPGKGGRNQEAALAALNTFSAAADWKQISLLCAGTDGEDGPTDAAGAFVDERVAFRANQKELDLHSSLQNHNSYPLFDAVDGLFRTGPTHTNVMDLAVGVVDFD